MSVLLISLYAVGAHPVSWPALPIAVVLVNLVGDGGYAVRDERRLKRGGVRLCNDVVGTRAPAEVSFAGAGGTYRGTVRLAGEPWHAVRDQHAATGDELNVAGAGAWCSR